jgi:hypothetical protein
MDNPSNVSAYLGVANLRDEQINELKALESEMGVVIIAIKPTVPIAPLSQDQIAKLQAVERKMGVILLACQPQAT